MKIKRIERGLKLSSFECDVCAKEVEVKEVWSLEVEGESYRIHVCVDCLREILLEEEGEEVSLTIT